jgi:hypothetical protein
MISLESFVTAVKSAVHQAAHIAREQNLQMVYRFFEVREPSPPEPPPEPPSPGRDRPQDGLPLAARKPRSSGGSGGGSGGGGGGISDPPGDPENAPVLTPRMVAFEYPIDTPDGPALHTAFAPLVSLTGMQALEIAEFRLVLKVHVAEDGETVSLAFPGAPQTGVAGRPRRARGGADAAPAPAPPDTETGTIEIVLKSVDPPAGFYEIIRGYDRALRANIPG